jgi:hypothetical protein
MDSGDESGDSQDSGGEEMGHILNDSQPSGSHLVSRVPGAGSGNMEILPIERSGGGHGGQQHVGPGAAIPSQSNPSIGNNQHRNVR